jgi:hypothetical protein
MGTKTGLCAKSPSVGATTHSMMTIIITTLRIMALNTVSIMAFNTVSIMGLYTAMLIVVMLCVVMLSNNFA